ncbi:MAG: GNAT family N-acetyltransferase [Eubacteriales bacterium]
MKENLINHPTLFLRYAVEGDEAEIISLIEGIADYENMRDDVVATPEILNEWMFKQKTAQCILAYEGETLIGYVLYFFNFSTFLGRAGLYLEDLFVFPDYRGKGYGKILFQFLANVAHERGCGRMEWSCLDWNQPSIDFYRSMGAISMDGWSVYRLSDETLKNAAHSPKVHKN